MMKNQFSVTHKFFQFALLIGKQGNKAVLFNFFTLLVQKYLKKPSKTQWMSIEMRRNYICIIADKISQ